MGWCKPLQMCPRCTRQQLFPASISPCCCAVPRRGADEGRKRSVFALTQGYMAPKGQSVFSQALTDLAALVLTWGAAQALQVSVTWCSVGTSWSPSWLSSSMVWPCFQNKLVCLRFLHTYSYIQTPSCLNLFGKCKSPEAAGGLLSHLRSASVSSCSLFFRRWGDHCGEDCCWW